jgi:hypothetical protein
MEGRRDKEFVIFHLSFVIGGVFFETQIVMTNDK